MNIQLKHYGKDIAVTEPDGTVSFLRACIYFERGDFVPHSFLKTETVVTGFVFEYKSIKYKCAESQPTNSELYHTLFTPFSESTSGINLDAVTL